MKSDPSNQNIASLTAWQRRDGIKVLLRPVCRGFLLGFGAKSISLLMGAITRRPFSLVNMFKALLREKRAYRWGCSLAVFVCFLRYFRARLDRAKHHTEGHADQATSCSRSNSIILGALAGSAILIAPRDAWKMGSLFLLVRAVNVHCRMVTSATKLKRIETVTFMLASAQIMWAWMFRRHFLKPSYLMFLDKFSRLPAARVRKISEAIRSTQKDAFMTLPQVLHPGVSTWRWHIPWWLKSYMYAAKIYMPLYFVPTILLRPKLFLPFGGKLQSTVVKLLLKICRSSAFLSSYTSAGWIAGEILVRLPGSRLLFNHLGPNPKEVLTSLVFGGLGCGSSILVEHPTRRTELTLFVLMQALWSLTLCLRHVVHTIDRNSPTAISSLLLWTMNSGVPPVVLTMGSMATLFHAYEHAPQLLRCEPIVRWLVCED